MSSAGCVPTGQFAARPPTHVPPSAAHVGPGAAASVAEAASATTTSASGTHVAGSVQHGRAPAALAVARFGDQATRDEPEADSDGEGGFHAVMMASRALTCHRLLRRGLFPPSQIVNVHDGRNGFACLAGMTQGARRYRTSACWGAVAAEELRAEVRQNFGPSERPGVPRHARSPRHSRTSLPISCGERDNTLVRDERVRVAPCVVMHVNDGAQVVAERRCQEVGELSLEVEPHGVEERQR